MSLLARFARSLINVKGIGNGLILHAMLVTFVTGSRIQIPVYH